MKGKKIRNLSDAGNQNVGDLAEHGKALPDLVRKKHIYESHKIMVDFASILSNHTNRNNGFSNDNDIYNLMSSMYVCWHMFNVMAYENKILNLYDQKNKYGVSDFDLISSIWRYKHFSNNNEKARFIQKLFHLVEYIDFCLHKLNLTNLLMDNISFDSDESTF